MEEVSGMDFYVAAELSKSVLNDIVATYTRIEFKEGRKQNPDFSRIREFDEKRSEVLGLLYKSENFSSLDNMNKIIEKYLPVLKQLKTIED